jgi:hypothetical protein
MKVNKHGMINCVRHFPPQHNVEVSIASLALAWSLLAHVPCLEVLVVVQAGKRRIVFV